MTTPVSVVLGVEYDGGAFHGFQRQRHAASVQQALEEAISRVAAEPVRVVAAGRTDAGVHATQQVVSFATGAVRSEAAWRRGVSSLTPKAIGIVWARVLEQRFNARFDARWRRYVYLFSDAPQPPVIHRGLVAWSRPLDAERMHDAAQCLVGEHDFSTFRAAACQSKSPWRRLCAVRVERAGEYVAIDLTANAFLLRMVRNIAAALREVGAGNFAPHVFAQLFARRDRTLAPATAPPQGLYLVAVGYPGLELPVRLPPLLSAAAPGQTLAQRCARSDNAPCDALNKSND